MPLKARTVLSAVSWPSTSPLSVLMRRELDSWSILILGGLGLGRAAAWAKGAKSARARRVEGRGFAVAEGLSENWGMEVSAPQVITSFGLSIRVVLDVLTGAREK